MRCTNTIRALGPLVAALALAPVARADDPQVGKAFRIPYRVTETNHYLVRARINGKGPFNLLVDSGAPFLFIGTEAAKQIGLEPPEDDYWTGIERLDLEGGAALTDLKARVEDPFQLVGMNALGLPGATIDGILGYTILARFRLEFDPTDDRMTWTRIDFEPKEPFIPRFARNRKGPSAPPEVQMMQALGPALKLASLFVGRAPQVQVHPQGLIGLELAEGEGEGGVQVAGVRPGSPAEGADIREGDRLLRIGESDIDDMNDAQGAVAEVRPGDRLTLRVRRGDREIDLELNAGEGL